MLVSIAKKILLMIPVLLFVSMLLFILLNVLPGDAAMSIAGSDASLEQIEALREKMGMNKSVAERYINWISGVIRGDFGISMVSGAPVSEKIAAKLPVTLELTLLSMAIAVLVAIPLGILAATHRNGILDTISSITATIGLAMPHFWLGMLLVMLFSVSLGWLPASGYTPITENLGRNLIQMIMPAFAIGFTFAATSMRQTRSAMLDVLNQDYISTAKSKGLSMREINWIHAFRNALIPVVTVVGMQTGRLFAGAIVVETVFALPGLGSAIVDSIYGRDYQVTMGCVLMVAVLIILINMVVDVLYVVIDPRISVNRGKA